MDEREEILNYLEQVRAEVVRRKLIVDKIDEEMAALEQSIKKKGGGLDVVLLKVQEGRRDLLQSEMERKLALRKSAVEDLIGAEKRQGEVVDELSEFDARHSLREKNE